MMKSFWVLNEAFVLFLKGFFPLWDMLSQAVIIQTQGGAKYSKLRKTHSALAEPV